MFSFSKNKRRLSRATTILLFVLISSKAFGGDHYHLRKPVQHYVNIHVAGGAIMPFRQDMDNIPQQTLEAPNLVVGIGGVPSVGLSYEIRFRRFFVNAGFEMEWELQDFTLKSFTDFQRNDSVPVPDATAMRYMHNTYQFHYTEFKESDTEFRLAVPMQFGYLFNSYFYGAVGLKYSWAVSNSFKTFTKLQTTMTLDNALSPDGRPIEVDHNSKQGQLYGIFPVDTISLAPKNTNTYAKVQMLSPSLELGARIPIAYRTVLRVGMYVEYGIPLDWQSDSTKCHVDYSGIWGEEGLWENGSHKREWNDLRDQLKVNPIKDSDWTVKGFNTLTIGIRATLSFNITPSKHWCNCEKDFAIHPRRGGGRIER